MECACVGQTGGAMQAFLKGTSVQSSKLQKDKGAPGTSTEKRVRPVPWVEK
jgi:hypothetical protein